MPIQQQLSASDHDLVTAAVKSAEAATTGEIVTIVAAASDHYADVPLLWSGLAALLALSVLAAFPSLSLALDQIIRGGWTAEPDINHALDTAFLVVLAMFTLVWLALSWPPAKLMFTPKYIRRARVRGRAIDLFRVGAERRTSGRTGILIYLSMAERRAEIVADEAIAALVAPESWGDVMADLIVHVRAGGTGAGLAEAATAVGAILAPHLPPTSRESNELPDRLIEL